MSWRLIYGHLPHWYWPDWPRTAKPLFASFNNPKGNADTERLMRTIKEDIAWPYDWDNPHAFEYKFKTWVHAYNNGYPHMALGYKTPAQFAQNTLLFAA